MRVCLVVILILPLPALADVCVRNGSEAPYLFAAETLDGPRVVRSLAPGERLCARGDRRGVVSVYESADALEGCSRLVPAGGADELRRYVDFDRCAWASHD